MDELPYAIMCELRALAGDSPSTAFKPIGNRRPSPEAMRMRRAYQRPLSAAFMSEAVPTGPESKYEYSASTQDLVDFGLIKHGFWHDGDRQTTQYGFNLTEKAVEILRAPLTAAGREKLG
jgi:hypothetical protein